MSLHRPTPINPDFLLNQEQIDRFRKNPDASQVAPIRFLEESGDIQRLMAFIHMLKVETAYPIAALLGSEDQVEDASIEELCSFVPPRLHAAICFLFEIEEDIEWDEEDEALDEAAVERCMEQDHSDLQHMSDGLAEWFVHHFWPRNDEHVPFLTSLMEYCAGDHEKDSHVGLHMFLTAVARRWGDQAFSRALPGEYVARLQHLEMVYLPSLSHNMLFREDLTEMSTYVRWNPQHLSSFASSLEDSKNKLVGPENVNEVQHPFNHFEDIVEIPALLMALGVDPEDVFDWWPPFQD